MNDAVRALDAVERLTERASERVSERWCNGAGSACKIAVTNTP